MSFAEAAFIEPMACVVHGMNRLQIRVGDRVLLFGAGAMGQQLIESIAHAGASELVVVDIAQEKLELALKRGATKGVLSEDLDRELGAEQYPNGFDIVVDATGIPKVIETAFKFMGKTAKYLQFGVTPKDANININPFDVYHKDWTILGSMAINHTFYPAFHWIKEGRIHVKPLISKTLSLEETVSFLEGPVDPKLLKVQITL